MKSFCLPVGFFIIIALTFVENTRISLLFIFANQRTMLYSEVIQDPL